MHYEHKETNDQQLQLVSVVVIAYKVGDYLKECLNSVINQTYKNIEIIVVDDGSPDDVSIICDNFKSIDTRIHIIHKKNEGAVYARRDGLLEAMGKYVIFVDGDDWLDADYIETLEELIDSTNADLSVGKFCNSFNTIEKVEEFAFDSGIYEGEKLEYLKEHLIYSGTYYSFGINPALWNKMFRREMLLKYFRNIPRAITLGDDFAISMPYMFDSERITISGKQSLYHYRQHDDSMMNRYNPCLTKRINCLCSYIDSLNLPKSQLQYYYSWMLAYIIKNAGKANESIVKKAAIIKNDISSYKYINCLNRIYRLSPKYRILFSCVRMHLYIPLAFVLSIHYR